MLLAGDLPSNPLMLDPPFGLWCEQGSFLGKSRVRCCGSALVQDNATTFHPHHSSDPLLKPPLTHTTGGGLGTVVEEL